MKAIALAAMLIGHAALARADDTIGLRAGWQWIYLEGDGPPSDLRGYTFDVDGSHAVARRASLAAEVDGSFFNQRSDRIPTGTTATSVATYFELRIDTNPQGPVSARIDLGTGIRWLSLPLSSGPTDRFWAWEPLRLRIGPAYRASSSTQIAVMAGIGFGWLVSKSRDGACAVTGACPDSLYMSDTQSSAHFVSEFGVVVRNWF